MANPSTRRTKLLKLFRQIPNIAKMGFLTSFFQTLPEDITDADFVSIDIVRSDEDIAPVLRDVKTGAVVIAQDVYTNKTVRPPAYALEEPLNVYDLLKRQPGETEYEATESWLGQMAGRVRNSWSKMMQMLKYSVEVQASQILQTGTLSLDDEDGNAVYTLDYQPKATHFPTVSTSWSTTASADPLADIDALADVIRDDGLCDTAILIMGATAFKNFLKNDDVSKIFNKEGFNLGALRPELRDMGGKIQGIFSYANYQYEVWTYNGRYKATFGASTKTKFVEDDKVIFLPETEELDFRKVFGGVPMIVNSIPPFDQFLPSRVPVPGAVDFKPRVYTDERAETVISEIKSRPLLIPVSIDKFGCLDTEI